MVFHTHVLGVVVLVFIYSTVIRSSSILTILSYPLSVIVLVVVVVVAVHQFL